MVKRFLASRRSGFYLSVVEEGDVAAGDDIVRVSRDPASYSIRRILELYLDKDASLEQLREAVALLALAPSWRNDFLERIEALA